MKKVNDYCLKRFGASFWVLTAILLAGVLLGDFICKQNTLTGFTALIVLFLCAYIPVRIFMAIMRYRKLHKQ